jgi:hypothetical protein
MAELFGRLQQSRSLDAIGEDRDRNCSDKKTHGNDGRRA